MKKILTVLTAVLLLCAMAVTMASCGKVDMTELKTTIDKLNDEGELTLLGYATGDDTGSKAVVTRYAVSKPGLKQVAKGDYLYIVEYANAKIAKLAYEQLKLEQSTEEKEAEIQQKLNEELVKLGDETDAIDDVTDIVIKRKGTVVIYGNEDLYDKIFG